MTRIMFIAGLLVGLQSATARAQPGIYVTGAVFADLRRGSGVTSPDSTTLDTTTAGGGVRVGAFLATRWSLELGVDAGASTDAATSISSASLGSPLDALGTGPSIVAVNFDRRVRTRVTATSILVGYHPPARGRLQAGFKGGMSFVHSDSTLTSTLGYRVTDPRLAPIVLLPAPTTTTTTSVNLDMAATVAAELAIALSTHAAIIPEVRALGFGNQLILRPGACLRWSF
jgi:hypothetical protein